MSFDKIISIPGMSGLFQMVAQMRNGGFVVEGLSDKRRIPVSAMQRIIMLKDVAIYTVDEDMPLYDVFKKMKENDAIAASVSPKSEPADLKIALKKILPEFDEERVHTSDIRKMFTWYTLLKDIIGSAESEAAMNPVAEEAAPVAEAPAEEKPKAKAKAKKEETAAPAEGEEAPKKKKVEVPRVVIEESKRGKKKHITYVMNLEKFGINLKDTSKLLSKKCACSATVTKEDNGQEV